uniref:Uncharacterized protein n=1 Tax=Acrobeloides nanus TaxID=290746 RepID=A0A914CZC6_9BILA
MKKGFLLALSKSDQPTLSDPIIEEEGSKNTTDEKLKVTKAKPKPIVPKLKLKKGEKLLCEDYTNGSEDVPISVVNGVDQEDIPKIAYHVSRYTEIPRLGLELIKSQEICSSCTCTDGCLDPKKCKCQIKSEDRYYDLKQFNNMIHIKPTYYKEGKLEEKIFSGIYECNKNCKCREDCKNRVTQNRINIPLQIFKTKEIGWGVRTLIDIPKGSYIATYSGQLMTDEQVLKFKLDNDGKYPDEYNVYLSDLVIAINSAQNAPVPRNNVFLLDASKSGNIARFFNHSCEPNMFAQYVFMDTHDVRLPEVAFFAKRFILAGEELCWDYGYEPGTIPDREMVCKCGASDCRGRLL